MNGKRAVWTRANGEAALWLVRVLIVLAALLPFVPLLLWSFSFRWYFPAVLPTEWSLRPWTAAFAPQNRLWLALGNSLWVAGGTTFLSILIGLPAGRALGLHQFRGKTIVEFLILMPTIVPALSAALGIHIMFIRYGLSDTRLGVILVHLIPVLPYMVLILSSVFANYNTDFEDQARSLGASPWQLLRHVMLPTIFPGLLVGSLFAFIISWSQYILTVLIGGGRVLTLPLLLFATANSGDTGLTAALSLIFIAPAVLFLLLASRYLTGQNAALSSFGKI